mgnify:CR=1 FL=1
MLQQNMLSLEKCSEVLNSKERKFTKEQVKLIRAAMYQIAGVMLEIKKDENDKS